MSKVIKKLANLLLHTLSGVVLVAILLILGLALAFSLPRVQTFVADKATDWLAEECNVRVSVGAISLENISRLVAEEVYVEDLAGDTLLWVGKLSGRIDRDALLHEGRFVPYDAKVKDAKLYIIEEGEGGNNIDKLIYHFETLFPADTTSTGSRFEIKNVEAENFRFRLYQERFAGRTPPTAIDYSDMDILISSAHFETIAVEGADVILTNIQRLNAVDKSGAELHDSSLGSLLVGEGLLDFKDVDFLSGGSHLHLPYLILSAPDWKDYSQFNDKVTLNLNVQNSTLEPLSAGKWVAELGLYGAQGENINGYFEGVVNNFATDFMATMYDSEVTLIGEVKSITSPENINADLNVELATTPEKIKSIYRGVLHSDLPKEAEVWVDKFDSVSVRALARLIPNKVITDALIGTNLGDVEIRGTIGYGSEGESFEGDITTQGVELGKLLSTAELGRADLNLDGRITHKAKVFEGEVNAQVERLDWAGYDFGDISLHASLTDSLVRAQATSYDPNVLLYAEGEGNLSGEAPEYDLILNVENVDLGAMGFSRRGNNSWFSGNMEASLSGRTIDDMVGRAMINNLVYASTTDTLTTELVNIALAGGEHDKSFSLYSPIVDIKYRSSASYKDVLDYLTNTLPSQLPLAAKPLPEGTDGEMTYGDRLYAAEDHTSATINIKEGENLAAILLPDGNLAPDSSVSLEFSPSAREFSLVVESDYFAAGDVVVSALRAGATGAGYNLELNAECDELLAMGISIPEISVQATTQNEGAVDVALYFSNSEAALSGRLVAGGKLSRDEKGAPTLSANILDSYIISPNNQWDIAATAIDYTSQAITIDGFSAKNESGGLYIDGQLSNSQAPLNISLENVELGEWLSLLANIKDFKGVANGNITLHSAMRSPYGVGSLSLSGLSIGSIPLDPLDLKATIPTKSTTAQIALHNSQSGSTLAEGTFDYRRGNYWADVQMSDIELSMLNPLLTGVASDIAGSGDIDLQLSGQKSHLDIDGGVRIADLGVKLDITGATYSSDSVEITFEDNRGVITPVRIADGQGGWAEVEGYIDLQRVDNVGFGIWLVPHNLVAIDLPTSENAPFYGKVSVSGGLKLLSSATGTDISGAITTGAGSIFNLPLTSNNDFAGADFVTFVDRSEEKAEESGADILVRKKRSERSKRESGGGDINLDVMLNVDTNTLLRLIVDMATDNIIEARGVADLGITYNGNQEDFAIRGDYEISEGIYNFNFQDLITRKLDINPDSYIRWNGSPMDATINVGATYKLKTSLAPLMGTENTSSRASTPVECIVDLTGSLSQVNVSFDINVPNANTEYHSILSSYFSSQEMMATQFIYLLTLGNFYSDTAPEQTNTPGAGTKAVAFDILASQISQLVSNDTYQFNLRYKAIDETSSSYSVDFQTEIIKDKLLLEVEANVDTGDYYKYGNENGNQLTGGGSVTYLLDENGDFYLKGFSRTIDRFDENQGLQEQGFGVYYKRSFDHLSDLWRKKKDDKVEVSEKSDTFVTNEAPNEEGANENAKQEKNK